MIVFDKSMDLCRNSLTATEGNSGWTIKKTNEKATIERSVHFLQTICQYPLFQAMANRVSLMDFLQHGLPAIPIDEPANPGSNTTNTAYQANEIHDIRIWRQFTLDNILRRYQNLLITTMVQPIPQISPPLIVGAKNPLRHRITELVISRLRRALRRFRSISRKQSNEWDYCALNGCR